MTIKVLKILTFLLVVLLGLSLSNKVNADPTVIKAYKTAFPDSNPRCMDCHLPSFPWEHPWNAYGKTVKKAINASGVGEVPTGNDVNKIADVLKRMGKVEDFKASSVKQ